MLNSLRKTDQKRRNQDTDESLRIQQKSVELTLMKRISYGVFILFSLSVIVALATIVLRGLKVIDISDDLIYYLLAYSVAQIAPIFLIVVRFIFVRR
jgi:hypothetical protein